jgi:hypothetical protein
MGPPAPAWVYELTPRGHDLLPVLGALARWGGGLLDGKQPTDAQRGHWFAIPLATLLQRALPGYGGVVELRVDGARCYLRLGSETPDLATDNVSPADAVLTLGAQTAADLAGARTTLGEALAAGRLDVAGESVLADALRAG